MSLIAPLTPVLGRHFAAFILAVHAYKRVCADPVIAAFDVKDRRHLARDPLAHEAVLRFVLLQKLGVGVQSAAHSTAITLENLVM